MNYTLLVPLTSQQQDARRQLLNHAGHLAYLSPALPLLAIACYTFLSLSPPKTASRAPPTALQKAHRRLSWLLSTPLSAEFGSLHTHLLGATYLLWLLYLIFRNTGTDYMHLTKAFGHVAASQLPWQYLLAVKSPWNPVQLLLKQSHEDLNDAHRLFGRIVHGLLAAHAVLYLNFFVRVNVLEKRLKDPVVRLGLLAFWAFNFLAVLSMPLVRRRMYHRLFYRSHVLLSAVVLPLLYAHVPYTRRYIVQAGVLYVVNGVTRALASSPPVSVTVEKIEGTSLLRLQADGSARAYLSAWTPGQHVYLKQSNSPITPKTPFTVVAWSSSSENGSEKATVDLVVRTLGGPQTGFLAAEQQATLMLEGPYGESKNYIPSLLSHRKDDAVLLVAGGVGATYTLPIYLALLGKFRSSTNIAFVWFVKSTAEAVWVVDVLQDVACDVDVSIYVTGGAELDAKTDLGELKKGITIYPPRQREHVANVVDDVFAKDTGRVYVFACGPSGMARALRTEVGSHVMRDGRDVVYRQEQFGLGSS